MGGLSLNFLIIFGPTLIPLIQYFTESFLLPIYKLYAVFDCYGYFDALNSKIYLSFKSVWILHESDLKQFEKVGFSKLSSDCNIKYNI